MELVAPDLDRMDSYLAALRRGWAPDTSRPASGPEALAEALADPEGVVAGAEDRTAARGPVTLPDGTRVPRLPGLTRWIWDDDGFCGGVGMRWTPGSTDLPPTCLGHVGYSVVPWKQRRGYATRALALALPLLAAEGLPWCEAVTDADNVASQRVLAANGAVLVERFTLPEQFGSGPALRWRIALT